MLRIESEIRKVGRRVGRLAAAGVVAALPLLGGAPTARTDGRVIHGWEGNNQELTLASDNAGDQVLIYAPEWINVCGNTYRGPIEFGVNFQGPGMQLVARGPHLYDDEPGSGGTDYPSGAATIAEATDKRADAIGGERQRISRLRVVYLEDRANNQICQEVFPDGSAKTIAEQTTPEAPAQPAATAVPVGAPGAARIGGECNPIAVTSLGPRPDAVINGTRVHLEVRDLNSCVRPLFRHETGVGAGQNYKISLPDSRWSVIIASTTAEVQREGGMAQRFQNGPVIKIQGPFEGGAGLFEGAFDVVPEEWADPRIQQIMPIQRLQVGDPNRQPVLFVG